MANTNVHDFHPILAKSVCSRGVGPKPSANGRPMLRQHILVVDDDATIQEVLTFFLRGAYDVEHAATAGDALLKLQRDPVDLVLLDHRLPDRMGLDILPELRSIRSNLPVIMMTGYGSEWICATAFKLGVADYLQKPVNAVELIGAVQRVLRPKLNTSDHASDSLMSMAEAAGSSIPIQRALGIIQECYWDHLSLSTLARHVGISKYCLSRRFHEAIGLTFRDYLLKVRLERAKSLLTDGHAPITEVAQMVGFGDLPRFDKLFKRYTGVTPSIYRSLASARVDT
jgi:two-component system, response regulator YesN